MIHAPRQVGKTTVMLTLAQELTASGEYTALMVSVEVGSAFPDQPEISEKAILSAWLDAADFWLPSELNPDPHEPPIQRIGSFLKNWVETSPRPVVLFIDEIDSLQNQSLINVLRQLRDGFPRRPKGFPQSVGLVGMRDVRDYKYAAGDSDHLSTSSPFNIKVQSFTLRNFNLAEVTRLYAQHTEATGQIFTEEAVNLAFHLTQGQPWLVNAIAKEITEYIADDPAIPITVELINQAKEILTKRQDTHLDSLVERLREDPLSEGLKQLDKYLSGLNLDTGWLVIFDRREGLPPISDRTSTEITQSPDGRSIIVIRG